MADRFGHEIKYGKGNHLILEKLVQLSKKIAEIERYFYETKIHRRLYVAGIFGKRKNYFYDDSIQGISLTKQREEHMNRAVQDMIELFDSLSFLYEKASD